MKKYLVVVAILFLFLQNTKAQEQQFKLGDKAADINAITNDGSNFSLEKATKKGSVIVLFYRGYWCPFCSKQLKELNDSLEFLTAKGVTVVAITPENVESVAKTVTKTKASFAIISDTTNCILKAYGVNFKVEDKTIERYKGFGVDLVKTNSNADVSLPVPAVYIINKNRVFKYIWFEKDYRKRPSVKELLNNL